MASTEYSIGTESDVFTDRLYGKWPSLKGFEISEEEAREFEAQVKADTEAGRIPEREPEEFIVGAPSDVERDYLFTERPYLRGSEV